MGAMRILFLGSGTSTGVPVIGCKCNVCLSDDSRDKRTRASILITNDENNILIDTSTDLRFQVLTYDIEKIDVVLFTHTHADHIHGIDDLRSFNHKMGGPIPCYGNKETVEVIKRKFSYIFNGSSENSWIPNLSINIVKEPFHIYGLRIVPVKIFHGERTILGYRINNIAYITDCSGIPSSSMELLKDLSILILGAIRYKPHSKHYGLYQAIEVIENLKPERSILTHLSHSFEYRKVSRELPPGIELAYDGMEIEV